MHPEDVKFFIGPKGSIHRDIMRLHGCKVHVKDLQEDGMQPVLVSGSLEQVSWYLDCVMSFLLQRVCWTVEAPLATRVRHLVS